MRPYHLFKNQYKLFKVSLSFIFCLQMFPISPKALWAIDEPIQSEDIANNVIKNRHIENDSIRGDKIKFRSLSGRKLRNNTIEGMKIKEGTLKGKHIKDQSIGEKKIKDNAITASKLAESSVGTKKIKDASINPDKINSLDIPSDGDILSYNATQNAFEWIVAGGSGSSSSTLITEDTANSQIIVDGKVVPQTTDLYSLGSETLRWKYLYLASIIDFASNLTFQSGGTTYLTLQTGGDMILNGDMTAVKFIGDGSQLTNINVGTAEIVNGSITVQKIDGLTAGQFIVGTDGTATNNAKVVMSGDATMNSSGVLTLGNNVVNASKLNVPGNGSVGQVLSSDGDGSFSWVNGLSNALADGKLLIGNGSNVATAQSISGDATMNNTGKLTISTSAITSTKLADKAVTTTKINNGAVKVEKIDGLAAGQFIIGTDGTATNNAKVVMSKDATMDASGQLTISSSAITSTKLANNAVTSTKILDGEIVNSDISGIASIAFSKLNISKSDITGLGIPGSDTDTTYVAGQGLNLNGTTFTISDIVVTSNYSGTITANAFVGDGGGLTNLNIDNSGIANGAVTANKIEGLTAGQFIVGTDGTAANNAKVTMSKDATMNSSGQLTISSSAITSAKLANNAVSSSKLQSGSVTGDKILDTSISSNDLGSSVRGVTFVVDPSGNGADFIDIQSAIDALGTMQGGTIVLKSGSYTQGSTLFINKHAVRIVGDSYIAQIDGNLGAPLVNVMGQQVIFENIQIINNGSGPTVLDNQGASYKNCSFENQGTGLTMNIMGYGAKFTQCDFSSNTSSVQGLQIQAGSARFNQCDFRYQQNNSLAITTSGSFTGLRILDSVFQVEQGIDISPSVSDFKISGCEFQHSGIGANYTPISFQASSDDARGIISNNIFRQTDGNINFSRRGLVISDNVFSITATMGISDQSIIFSGNYINNQLLSNGVDPFVITGTNHLISGNKFNFQIPNGSIDILNAYQVSFSNNNLYGSDSGTNLQLNNSDRCNISNNILDTSAAPTIDIDNDSDNNTISGNVCSRAIRVLNADCDENVIIANTALYYTDSGTGTKPDGVSTINSIDNLNVNY